MKNQPAPQEPLHICIYHYILQLQKKLVYHVLAESLDFNVTQLVGYIPVIIVRKVHQLLTKKKKGVFDSEYSDFDWIVPDY